VVTDIVTLALSTLVGIVSFEEICGAATEWM